jgi:hypothetical protein
MPREFHYNDRIAWPDNHRIAVTLTFDARTLRAIIRHMKKAEGVWFATGSEVARRCLDRLFKPQREVAAF